MLLGAFATVAAFRPGVGDANLAFVDNKATDEVKAAAQHALTTLFSYDPKNLDKFKETARQELTGKALADSDKYLDPAIDAARQTQTKAEGTIDPIGVTFLTSDRAELLVNLTVNSTKDGAPQESASGPVVVHMQKVNGRWLVSDIPNN
ncbi:hypothetical protein [Nocardia transvalensis]|uniref:hypothetical protein n=1 Tax=Nocardia transvalensis TaxID=37333 RepID=UPI001E48286C|nr:hypothetical protein [Nocardia transvalensis]